MKPASDISYGLIENSIFDAALLSINSTTFLFQAPRESYSPATSAPARKQSSSLSLIDPPLTTPSFLQQVYHHEHITVVPHQLNPTEAFPLFPSLSHTRTPSHITPQPCHQQTPNTPPRPSATRSMMELVNTVRLRLLIRIPPVSLLLHPVFQCRLVRLMKRL